MDDLDRAEMRELCDAFRRAMARGCNVLPFDRDARERIGEMIGRAARRRRSDYAVLR